MSHIPVSKGLLAGLVGVSATAVVGVAYLLGRESARTAPAPAPPVVQAAPALPVSPTAIPEPQATPMVPTMPAAAPVAASAPAPTRVTPPPRSQGHGDREGVLAYFKAVDALMPELKGDPEGAAQGILAGFSKGDTSAFDAMDQQSQTALNRLQALTPPPPCAGFHRESLACMQGELAMMREMKKAMAGNEVSPDALTAISTQANALKARGEALQNLEKSLIRQYSEAQ